jgi:hypothetical protein
LSFDNEGVCRACHYYELRLMIDWEGRQKEFLSLVEQYRSKDGSNYDCNVPVSGGKDINKVEVINKEHIRSIRPGYGLEPKFLTRCIGINSESNYKRGEPVPQDFLL